MRVEDLVAFEVLIQDHLLEEPGRMCDVPPRGAYVDDRLRDVILGLEGLAQFFRVPPGRKILRGDFLNVRSDRTSWLHFVN